MTKKDLIKWVEKQRECALNEVEEKKCKALASCKEKIIEEIGLDEVASEIQKKFNEIDGKLRSWKAGLDPDITVSNNDWCSMVHDLSRYVDLTKDQILCRDLQLEKSKACRKIKKKFDEMKSSVNREYTNVIVNVRGLKNAKLIAEYLESLGFDLTKFKEVPLTTALSVPINTDYLFIGGERNE